MSTVSRASKLGVLLFLGLSALTIQPSRAESPESAIPMTTPEVNSDPFSTRGDNTSAVMDLMHRAMRGDLNVDRAAQASDQRESLNDAAADFFAKRNARLKEKSSGSLSQTLEPSKTNGLVPVSTDKSTKAAPANPNIQSNVQPVVPGVTPTSAELLMLPTPAAKP